MAYIISGVKKKSKVVIGKASIRIPFFERLDKLNLRLIPIDVKTSNAVPTADYININVDATKPVLTVRADTSGSLPRHKATITATGADSIRYVWTKDTALPGYGWQTITSGTQLTESRGTAGQTQTWYLHVLATAASGASTHQYQAFTFMNPAITDVSVRAGNTTASADAADVWKTGNISWCSMRVPRAQGQSLPLTDQRRK